MSAVLSFVAFVLVLGGIIFVHELGHFLFAKLSGIKVEEFSMGFGPKLYGVTRGDTLYKLSLFPIGGYVKMLGEEEQSDDPKSFSAQPISQRLAVVLAGVVMNILFAGVLYYIFLGLNSFTQVYPVMADYDFKLATVEETFIISSVAGGSPSEIAGIEPGDLIRSVDGVAVYTMDDFADYIGEHLGEEVTVTAEDLYGENVREVSLIPRELPPEGEGSLGVTMVESKRVSYQGWQKAFSGFSHSFNMIGYTVVMFKDLVVSAFETGDVTYVSDNISGPVGIYVATDMVLQSSGLIGLLDIAALMSSSLAMMNILPFPALDGGHAIILLIEKARGGKKMNGKLEGWLTAAGFIALMGLMLLISTKDLFQYGVVESVIDFLTFWN